MNDEQVNKLLDELRTTRESFNNLISSVKWNKRNTTVQYCLIVVIFILGSLGVGNYLNDRKESCENANQFRFLAQESMQQNAIAIGTALAVVTDAPAEKFQEYMDAYDSQKPTEAFKQRKC